MSPICPTPTPTEGASSLTAVDRETIERVLAEKRRRRSSSHGYQDRPNDFLSHSNDLHEIRILDRAIRFARSDIVCLVQDDDRIPRETDWLDAALRSFG